MNEKNSPEIKEGVVNICKSEIHVLSPSKLKFLNQANIMFDTFAWCSRLLYFPTGLFRFVVAFQRRFPNVTNTGDQHFPLSGDTRFKHRRFVDENSEKTFYADHKDQTT